MLSFEFASPEHLTYSPRCELEDLGGLADGVEVSLVHEGYCNPRRPLLAERDSELSAIGTRKMLPCDEDEDIGG